MRRDKTKKKSFTSSTFYLIISPFDTIDSDGGSNMKKLRTSSAFGGTLNGVTNVFSDVNESVRCVCVVYVVVKNDRRLRHKRAYLIPVIESDRGSRIQFYVQIIVFIMRPAKCGEQTNMQMNCANSRPKKDK